jgi:hypothetical protein
MAPQLEFRRVAQDEVGDVLDGGLELTRDLGHGLV